MSQALKNELTTSLRLETPADLEEIRQIHIDAFGRSAEADLIDALRNQGQITVSLVAATQEEVIGNAVLSPVTIMPTVPGLKMLGLGPMAVRPGFQLQGVGSKLIGRGTDVARMLGCQAMVVLGPPDYYERFGFAPASRYGLRSEFDESVGSFMVIELHPGSLSGWWNGVVRYQPEFWKL
jgi:putative acetyltransferase